MNKKKLTIEEIRAIDKEAARQLKELEENLADSTLEAMKSAGEEVRKRKAEAAALLKTVPDPLLILNSIEQKGAGFETVPRDESGRWTSGAPGSAAPKGNVKIQTTGKVDAQTVAIMRDITRRGAEGKGKEVKFHTVEEVEAVLKEGDYSLISAGKNPRREDHKDKDEQFFRDRHAELGDDLEALGVKYVPVVGKYGGIEDTYLVMANELTDMEAVELGAKYEQDSIIHVQKGVQKMIFTTDSKLDDGTVIKKWSTIEGRGFKDSTEENDNYTEITLSNGKKVKYTLNLESEMIKRKTDKEKSFYFKIRPPKEDVYFGAAKEKQKE